ncbi:hypothetical protein BDN72DRAFT_862990 [Pluteus cervinus]|uniref:Uncharacterized protein n=1 Tax=Pluteus cervinus TaxID=181527 RepID=A0ACD3A9Z9_9AGAR|nr:hypothetical protein BDN72DRAFT_862990 [Pluteus cervinus]
MATTSLDETYGSLLIGVYFAIFFQGVLTVQTFLYYDKYPKDRIGIKFMVGTLWILDTVHLALVCDAAYGYLVRNWGNTGALLFSSFSLDAHLIPLALATVIAQGFFLYRIWIFSGGNSLLVAFLAAGCLVTAALEMATGILVLMNRSLNSFKKLEKVAIAMFSLGPAFDVIIALSMCWYLLKEKGRFEKTNSLITRIMYHAVASGLATSLLAIAALIAYLASPNSFDYIGIHFSLGRMYTNALLASLNTRKGYQEGVSQITVTKTVTSVSDRLRQHETHTIESTSSQPPLYYDRDHKETRSYKAAGPELTSFNQDRLGRAV